MHKICDKKYATKSNFFKSIKRGYVRKKTHINNQGNLAISVCSLLAFFVVMGQGQVFFNRIGGSFFAA